MSRNGSGTYSLPVGNPVVTGTTISSTWANTTLTDISNALTGSLASDGQTTATGNLNMGTNKVVNAADPTNPQDLATKNYTDTEIAAAEAVVIASITPANVSNKLNTSTGYFQVPLGTALQRPASPQNGIVRYNTDSDFYEGYIDGDWVRFQTFSQGNYLADYLIVAGGGGGGSTQNAFAGNSGAGAGGYLTTIGGTQATFVPGTVLTVAIGAGGAAGANGTNSSITGYTSALGGGAGAPTGGNGGSGGGAGGAGTVGQGNNGGVSGASSNDGNTQSYPGGGGAGGAGSSATGGGASAAFPGPGGVGLSNNITGTSIFYAGGGGGGSRGTPGASGGNGGGGAGGGSTQAGTAGTVNTGGGGGGAGADNSGVSGGAGGSGVVIIRVPTVNYSGTTTGSPTVTTSGSNTVIKFTASGSYTA
jgi:hypothetical protein